MLNPRVECDHRGWQLVVIADTRSLPSTPGEATPAAKAQTVTLGGIGDPDGLDLFLSSAGEWVGPKVRLAVGLHATYLLQDYMLYSVVSRLV